MPSRTARTLLMNPQVSMAISRPIAAGLLHEQTVYGPARAVDENVDAAHRALHELDRRGDRIPVGDVTVARRDRSRRRLALDLFRLLVVDVGDDHARALGGKAERDGASKIRGSTGDDDNAAVEAEVHAGLARFLPGGSPSLLERDDRDRPQDDGAVCLMDLK